jgi:hypothetical protein
LERIRWRVAHPRALAENIPRVETWLFGGDVVGLMWALTFVPCLVMELGVAHLLLDLGPVESDGGSTRGSTSAPLKNESPRMKPGQATERRR